MSREAKRINSDLLKIFNNNNIVASKSEVIENENEILVAVYEDCEKSDTQIINEAQQWAQKILNPIISF